MQRSNLTVLAKLESLEQRRLLAGELDPVFAGGAVFGPDDSSGRDVAVQQDGKVVVLYDDQDVLGIPSGGFNVARYNTNGTLDSSFGTGGIAAVSFGSRIGLPHKLAIQSDGKIVIGGAERTIVDNTGVDDPVVVRLTAAGKLDTSFSGDGKVEFTGTTPGNDYYILWDLVLPTDGKIVFSISGLDGKSAVVRLDNNGGFDNTFEGDGIRRFDQGGQTLLSLAPDNKIVFFGGGIMRRLLDNGSSDPSFNGGRPKTISGFTPLDALVTQQNKILFAGIAGGGSSGFQRRNKDGGVDSSFGVNGIKPFDFGGIIFLEMTYAPDGKIVVASYSSPPGSTYGAVQVARFTGEADPDDAFGTDGIASAQLKLPAFNDEVAIAPDGNIITTGYVSDWNGSTTTESRYFVARFVGDGAPPSNDIFINDGVLTINGTTGNDTITVNPSTGGNVIAKLNGTSSIFALSAFSSILVNANAGNDSATINGAIIKPAKLLGGAGNDSLFGGGGDDALDGQDGGDTMKGGAGLDTLDYSSRTASLMIGPGTLSDDGEAGEKDNVATDFETILGGGGNDTIKGTAGDNLLVGNGGDDSILANFGNDTLSGDAGTDALNGEGGTDTSINASGDTLISIENGGGGVTASIDAQRRLIINGTAGNDDISLYINDNEAGISGNGGPTFARSAFDSIIINGIGGSDDVEIGRDGNTAKPPILVDGHLGSVDLALDNADATVLGGAGIDGVALDVNHGGLDGSTVWFTGGAGDDRIFFGGNEADNAKIGAFDGGAGIDSIWAGWPNSLDFVDLRLYPGVENVSLNLGTIIGNDLPNKLELDEGGGSLIGNGGNDTLAGGENQVFIDGGDGDDYITAFSDPEPENAELIGGNGNDTIFGGPLNDHISGGPGNDSMDGGLGDDVIDGGTGSDTIEGGGGLDTADYSSRSANLTIGIGTLADDGEAGEKDNVYLDIEKILGGSGNDIIKGHANDNVLLGNGGNDSLYGNYGADALLGGTGNDQLFGEGNNDYLEGGGDADTMNGGGGNDSFYAIDGLVDQLIGGSGADSARRDANDVLSEIESSSLT